jgi:hypothetical protein
MAISKNAVPIRWQSGPLDIARREKQGDLSPEARKALERWHDPAALTILKSSPIDCLVLSWAAGLPQDTEQQKSLGPLLAAARTNNLATLGWVDGTAAPEPAIAAAKAAGLSAVAIKGFAGKSDFPVIAWGNRSAIPYDSPGPVLPLTDNVWPGVSVSTGAGGADAGPTSLPWIDSNGWFARMVSARSKTPVWLLFDPPGRGAIQTARAYTMAICDSEAAGGRWVLSLDDNLRAGLADMNPAALQSWREIAGAAAFFPKHGEWRSYISHGLVGVISDFAGENFDRNGELLNLMARRDLLYRVIWKSTALQSPFSGLKALVSVDQAQPAPELRRKLLTFVEAGGLLVAPKNWGTEGKPLTAVHPRFEIRAQGKGRIAVPKEDLGDPYELAGDVQILLSHANDLVKFFNSSSSGCTQYSGASDGSKSVVQALTYAAAAGRGGRGRGGAAGGRGTRPTGQGGGGVTLKTLWVHRQYRGAKLWQIDKPEPEPIEQTPAEDYGGVEFRLPETAQGYFAIELES